MLTVETFVCGPLENNVYLLVDPETSSCAIVDPGISMESVHSSIASRQLHVKWLLLTHGHFDHAFSLADCQARYGAKTAMHAGDLPMLNNLVETSETWGVPGAVATKGLDIELVDGQQLQLGNESIRVIHTPGHSPGQVAFVTGKNALVGDTLFKRSVGRWDLPGADWFQLEHSIRDKLFALPDETVVWPGHGEHTTIGDEKLHNPFLGQNARLRPKL